MYNLCVQAAVMKNFAPSLLVYSRIGYSIPNQARKTIFEIELDAEIYIQNYFFFLGGGDGAGTVSELSMLFILMNLLLFLPGFCFLLLLLFSRLLVSLLLLQQ
jgi:hypothetical protein